MTEFEGVSPPTPARGPARHEADARRVIELFKACEWVGPPRTVASRRTAEGHAWRLVKYLQKIDRTPEYKWRVWKDGEAGWRWAVRRTKS